MTNNHEYFQAMAEKQQMLEEALQRAEEGVATQADWGLIRYECGASRRPNLTETRSE